MSENTPTSSRHTPRRHSNKSKSTGNSDRVDAISDRKKSDEVASLSDDLKDADDFLNDMDDFDDMIRNSPRLVSKRLRLTKIDESKSEDKKLDKLDVVKDVTHTDKRESDSVENTAEKSKCIANKYSRYINDDDEIDAIVDELINDDYSSVTYDQKRSRSRLKQNKSPTQKSKTHADQYYLDAQGPSVTNKYVATSHTGSCAINNTILNNDIDDNIKVVDHFEPSRAPKKVKSVHSEFSQIKNADSNTDDVTNTDNVEKDAKNAAKSKGKRKSHIRSKKQRHKSNEYEYDDSDVFNIAPVTNRPIEVEVGVLREKDNENTCTSEPESYFQQTVKKTNGTRVKGKRKAKKTPTTDRENLDLIEVLQEVKRDKTLNDETKEESKDADIVTKLGSVVIRIQSEHQITTRKDGYDETLTGAVPQNVRKTIVKSVTIIDTGDAGIVIIKMLKRRSRIREMFCGCFSSDSRDSDFDFGEHPDENIECSDGNSKGNAGNYFNNDVLHFEVNKEGCFRRLWRRLRGRI